MGLDGTPLMDSKTPDPEAERASTQVVVVEDSQHGSRLGDYLPRRWPDVDRVFLRNLVLEGCVLVNGATSDVRQRLRAGDVVVVELPGPVAELPRFRAPTEEIEVGVLYEDDEVLVVDKPAGVPSVPDRGGKDPGLQGALQAARADEDLRILDRRGTEVSGCALFSKSLEDHKRLQAVRVVPDPCPEDSVKQFREEYLALVTGALRVAEQRVDRSIGPDPRRPGRVSVVESGSKGAREAVSTVSVEEAFRTHTLVRVVPELVRPHQIQVHLGHLGHPVVADKDYGVRDNLLLSEIKQGYKTRPGVVERPLLTRMFLHVARLAWPDRDGRVHTVEACLPPDLDLVLSKLRSFASRDRS